MYDVLGWIFFGAFTGWLASMAMGQRGEGCLVNTALGLVGALVGGFLLRALTGGHFAYEFHGFWVSTLVAVIGAVIVIALWRGLTGGRGFR